MRAARRAGRCCRGTPGRTGPGRTRRHFDGWPDRARAPVANPTPVELPANGQAGNVAAVVVDDLERRRHLLSHSTLLPQFARLTVDGLLLAGTSIPTGAPSLYPTRIYFNLATNRARSSAATALSRAPDSKRNGSGTGGDVGVGTPGLPTGRIALYVDRARKGGVPAKGPGLRRARPRSGRRLASDWLCRLARRLMGCCGRRSVSQRHVGHRLAILIWSSAPEGRAPKAVVGHGRPAGTDDSDRRRAWRSEDRPGGCLVPPRSAALHDGPRFRIAVQALVAGGCMAADAASRAKAMADTHRDRRLRRPPAT